MNAEPSQRTLIWLVALGFFMQALDSTIVNTALPGMAVSLGESPLKMQSVVIAYVLTVALLVPASGWMADRWGTRRVFLAAVLLFTAGSLLCAQSATLHQLIAARVVQGLGGAMLLPVGRLAVLKAVPRQEFLKAMSLIAIPGMVGPLMGPTLGGWLVQVASWHWIFLINLPVGLIGAVVTLRGMPDFRGQKDAPFDLTGFLLLATGMVTLTLALEGFAELGWPKAFVAVLMSVGLIGIAAYVLHAAHATNALFPLTLFRTHSFAVGLAGNLFARLGIGAMPLLLPLLFQVCFGYTALQAGLSLLPMALAGLVSRQAGPPLVTRFGYRRVLIVNTLRLGLCMALFGLITPETPHALRLALLVAFGAANAMQFTAMNTLALNDLPAAETSSGNGLLSVVMQLAMALGIASGAAVLGAFTDRIGDGLAGTALLPAFHATFVCIGLMTAATTGIFLQLRPAAPPAQRKLPVDEAPTAGFSGGVH